MMNDYPNVYGCVSNDLLFYSQGAIAVDSAKFGQGNGLILLDDLACTGTEGSIDQFITYAFSYVNHHRIDNADGFGGKCTFDTTTWDTCYYSSVILVTIAQCNTCDYSTVRFLLPKQCDTCYNSSEILVTIARDACYYSSDIRVTVAMLVTIARDTCYYSNTFYGNTCYYSSEIHILVTKAQLYTCYYRILVTIAQSDARYYSNIDRTNTIYETWNCRSASLVGHNHALLLTPVEELRKHRRNDET
ncbi:hypothetical protein DPMN_153779 [Dreissena polymorpha]|uniref:Uncharacterized protein n=1 Tax=Dreissena polymorpha TaxID=45954 RepID=A0A9D4J548_DREPO|nr:hypothetical protein DPMN_153779 [Dreissena polymorpha]